MTAIEGMYLTAIEKLEGYMKSGDWRRALKLASKWRFLGKQRVAIQRGWAAASNPDFYRQIGQDPDALVEAGINALRERYMKDVTE